jgi:galactokinase
VRLFFNELFGSDPIVTASAAGRVNLIGEHTDYNDGFVLPAALPLATDVQLAPRSDRMVRAWSAEFPTDQPRRFSLDSLTRADDWTDYLRGIAWVMLDRGLTQGFDASVSSTIPVGSGLSSSAALLVAAGRAIRAAFRLSIDDLELARIARKAETDFVGAPVGIMDQMACSLADVSSALFIDTRTLDYDRVALPADVALLVIDSGVRHSHVTGGYRTRREECAHAASALGVATLRDVDEQDLAAIEALPEPLNRRARHVVTENARVLAAVKALRAGDAAEVGRLFLSSHASLRDDFEVSTSEVDALVETTKSIPGVYGARITGGGFGGAIVALIEAGRGIEIGDVVVNRHNRRFANPATVIVPAPSRHRSLRTHTR